MGYMTGYHWDNDRVSSDKVFVYPGSFCPPTYGHVRFLERAAETFPRVIVVCSTNPDKKDRWFSEEECALIWKSYKLPMNIEIVTLGEFIKKGIKPSRLVMIRGIRNAQDLEHETKVMLYNQEKFGVDKYFYLFSECRFTGCSSSKARRMASDLELENLHELVSPLVISRLLIKVLNLKNLVMVVGRPGSGKSTFLREMVESVDGAHWINTDLFADELKPLIRERFGADADLIKLTLKKEKDKVEVIGCPWLDILKRELRQDPAGSQVFVEVPYGLQPGKDMFRFLGGKIFYIGCEDEKVLRRRVRKRGTPEHLPFISRIPGRQESESVCIRNRLFYALCDTTKGTAMLGPRSYAFFLGREDPENKV